MLVTPVHRAEIVRLEGLASEHEQLRVRGFTVLAVAITAHVVQRFVGSPGLAGALEAVMILGLVIGAPVAAFATLRQARVRRQLERARAPRELPAARIV